ncbi:MAG: dienelactone hydrolase family protein [Alphaproteobacteria bacterium]
MIEKEVQIKTDDGKIRTFITHPERGGPHPVILMYHDAPGIREELRDMARRFGTLGYYVILPNLYYRLGDINFPAKTHERGEKELKRIFEAIDSLTNDLVLSDTKVLLDYAKADEAASDGAKGCVGFCMSGCFAMYGLGKMPEHFRAAGSIHAIRHVTDKPDSPHRVLGNVDGELYFGFGSDDEYTPPEEIEELRGILDKHKINFTIDVFNGANHGYVFRGRNYYHKEASEQSWERLIDMFDRNLKQNPKAAAA